MKDETAFLIVRSIHHLVASVAAAVGNCRRASVSKKYPMVNPACNYNCIKQSIFPSTLLFSSPLSCPSLINLTFSSCATFRLPWRSASCFTAWRTCRSTRFPRRLVRNQLQHRKIQFIFAYVLASSPSPTCLLKGVVDWLEDWPMLFNANADSWKRTLLIIIEPRTPTFQICL